MLVILGTEGMLGSMAASYFERQRLPHRAIPRRDFDVLRDSPERLFEKLNCPPRTYVLNAIGIVNRRIPSTPLAMTVRINTWFPHHLAEACHSFGLRLIHLSTDCVFSGEEGGYTESSPLSPTDVYGMSKALGEPGERAMVIRTSFVGPEVKNFYLLFSWMLAQEGRTVPGYVNHFWNGVTSLQFAKVLEEVMEKDLFEYGPFHLFSPEVVTKEELIRRLAKAFKVKCRIVPQEANLSINRGLQTEKKLCRELQIPSLNTQIAELARSYQEKLVQPTPLPRCGTL